MLLKIKSGKRVVLFFIIACVYFFFCEFLVSYFSVLNTIKLKSGDLIRTSIFKKYSQLPDRKIVLIGIDNKTQEQFGTSLIWQRQVVLDLLKGIQGDGPNLILLDTPLQEHSEKKIDLELADLIKKNENLLSVVYANKDNQVHEPLPIFSQVRIGGVGFPLDLDGLVRRVQVLKLKESKTNRPLNSLGLMMLSHLIKTPIEAITHDKNDIPLLGDGSACLSFEFLPTQFRYFSAADVLNKNIKCSHIS